MHGVTDTFDLTSSENWIIDKVCELTSGFFLSLLVETSVKVVLIQYHGEDEVRSLINLQIFLYIPFILLSVILLIR